MAHNEAFLKAILDNPDDDTVRLIYADWLEEHGDPRAEFIRLQIELTRFTPSQRPGALTQREHYLIQTCGREWAGELTDFVQSWTFERGFVDGVVMRTQDFVADIDRVVQFAPIAHLQLVYDERSALPAQFAADAALFGTDPPLAHLRSLDLSANLLNDWDVRTLCAWTSLDRLETLDLSQNQLNDKAIRALAAAEFFPRLIELNLSDNAISTDGIRALEEAMVQHWERGQPSRLQFLRLGGNRLSMTARQQLTRTRFVKHVALNFSPTSRMPTAGSTHLNP